MFFHISRNQHNSFSHHWCVDNFYIGTDAGWKQAEIGQFWILHKGYCDNGLLETHIQDIIDSTVPSLTGNFCLLIYDKACLNWTVKTDLYRGFPMFFVEQECVTNFRPPVDAILVHANNQVRFDNALRVEWSSFQIQPPNTLNVTHISDIYDFLDNKISRFLNVNQCPIKSFLSGGVDTLLVFSFLKKYKIDFELIMGEHFDFDEFVLKNGRPDSNWSYGQLHHWQDSCVLASGTPGDEFTLRSPTYINWLLLSHGQDIYKILKQNPQCWHFEYFSKDKCLAMFADQSSNFAEISDLRSHIMNIIVNDFQHHHLGNTLTWTPLRDLRLFDLFWHLPVEDQIGQIFDSKISREIIEINVPGLSEVLSDQKNSASALANLTRLAKYH